MLILLLGGLWAGVPASDSLRGRDRRGNLRCLTPGTRSLFAEGSRVPESRVAEVRQTPGVRWASPVRTQYVILALHMHRVAASLIGADAGTLRRAQGVLGRTARGQRPVTSRSRSRPRAVTAFRWRHAHSAGRPLRVVRAHLRHGFVQDDRLRVRDLRHAGQLSARATRPRTSSAPTPRRPLRRLCADKG